MTSDTTQLTLPMKNTPLRSRAWRALLETDDAVVVEVEGGQMALVPQHGQVRLYYAFADIEAMRTLFADLFEALREDIPGYQADYLAIDLVSAGNRDWLDPTLQTADFVQFAEWMEMTRPELDPAPPQFPDGVSMRRAADGDLDRIRAISAEAFGELGDGPLALESHLQAETWTGVLLRDDEVVAFAINGAVESGEGHILSAAVAPEAWGAGYGKLVLAAAAYQFSTQDAARATITVRPDIRQSLRTCTDLGFRPGRAGIEYRRPVDESIIAEGRETAQFAGTKARFGNWR